MKSIQLKDIKIRTISNVIQKRLESHAQAIYIDNPPQLKAAEDYKQLCQETPIDLRKEYVVHLKMMERLKAFRDLRLPYDHAFFKGIV